MLKRLLDLFKRKPPRPSPPTRDLQQLLLGLPRPAVHLVSTIPRGTSFFGGAPTLPPPVWPGKNGKPLDFLAQIDLASVQANLPIPWLPARGTLVFFYDIGSGVWGFDPKDRGSWSVILQDVAVEPARAEGRVFVSFRTIHSYPSWQRAEVAPLGLSDEESAALGELADQQFGEHPRHQVGGLPFPIQNDDMELECQLASNGVFVGDGRYLQDPRTGPLEEGAADWRLLLQLDGDDEVGFEWGDCGTLYFFIREQDARAADFSKVWMVRQCH